MAALVAPALPGVTSRYDQPSGVLVKSLYSCTKDGVSMPSAAQAASTSRGEEEDNVLLLASSAPAAAAVPFIKRLDSADLRSS